MQSWPLLVLLLLCLGLHEWAHAFVAFKSGDRLPLRQGRLSLNPLCHMDLIGTLVLPIAAFLLTRGAFFIAYAKPVMIRPDHFRKPRMGLAVTAAAGPAMNLATGAVAAIAWRVLPDLGLLTEGLLAFALVSVYVGAFNLLPIPPLDGSKILQLCMPEPAAAWFLENGYWGLLGLGAIWAAGLVFLRVDLAERLADLTLLPILNYLLRG